MEPADLKILASVQFVGKHFIAWRGGLSSLITFIIYDMGEAAPSPEYLDLFLRKEETQKELAAHWETGLWRAADKTYRCIALAPQTDIERARRRLDERPLSPSQCRFCLVDEKRFSETELRPELDIHGEPVSGSFLHPACMRPWSQMHALVEREEVDHE